jgi:peptidoglycan/LPS O-acetylase OafA/YrhL
MNRETSIYLDIVRLSAAMTVFLGHACGQRLTGGILWQVAPYMSEAVIVFFVLSGFVIAYVTAGRESTAQSYAVSRFARIYSVALPTLLLGFALDWLGRAVNPAVYNASWGYQSAGQPWQFLSGLFFVHEVWFLNVPQGSNLPYWSLGYEVWYYAIFGLFMFTRRGLLWSGLAMAAAGPPILVLYPVWLLGVGAYRVVQRQWRIGVPGGLLLWAGSLAGWVAYEAWARPQGWLAYVPPDWLRRPELVQDYVVGTLFALNVVGFAAAAPLFAVPLTRIAPAVRWGAGLTFTLYLAHLPIAQVLMAVSAWPLASWPNRILVIGGTLTGVAALASVTERRKAVWRRLFARLLVPGAP